MVMFKFGWNVSDLLGTAAEESGKGEAFLEPGASSLRDRGRPGITSKLDLISLGLALVLGTAGLPHILIRFYTVPTAAEARKSVDLGHLDHRLVLPDDAGARLRRGRAGRAGGDHRAGPGRQHGGAAAGPSRRRGLLRRAPAARSCSRSSPRSRSPRSWRSSPGSTLASSSSVAHDIYANYVHRGEAPEGQEVKVARIAAFVIGAVAIVLSIFAQKLNVAFLVALAFAVAASGNLPAILYSLFWKRFNTTGAVSAIYGGLISAVVLVIFSPVVSGKPPLEGSTESPSLVTDTEHRLPLVPAGQPRPGVHPAGVLLRLARHGPEQGAQRGQVRRAGGAVAHRGRHGEGVVH